MISQFENFHLVPIYIGTEQLRDIEFTLYALRYQGVWLEGCGNHSLAVYVAI